MAEKTILLTDLHRTMMSDDQDKGIQVREGEGLRASKPAAKLKLCNTLISLQQSYIFTLNAGCCLNTSSSCSFTFAS